jgi:probable O-glycosylation ligase (exosortase A-associated)
MRIGFLVLFVTTVGTVILTFSRGGFLGLIVVLLGLFLRSRKRMQVGVGLVILVVAGLIFVPERWFERMGTIKTYESDASAMGRINAWWVAIGVAQDRPLVGGGFEMFSDEQFLNYAPNPMEVLDVHSIYFEIMGEHGFGGLAIYLALMFSAIFSLMRMARQLRNVPGFEWYVNYCDMFLLSIFAFLVNGATLGRAYFDLYFHLIAGVILLKVILRKEIGDMIEDREGANEEGDFDGKKAALVEPASSVGWWR